MPTVHTSSATSATSAPRRASRRGATAAAALLAVLLAACTSGGAEVGAEVGAGGGADGGSSANPSATAPAASPEPAGASVPSTSLTTFGGETVSFADYEGTPLVVNFWASWCPPCIAEMPDLEAVHEAAGERITFVGINTQDTPEEAEDLAAQTGVTYDLVRDPDGDLFREFGGFGMPSTFYVDADGQVVGRHTGLLTREALLEDLRDELGIEVEA